MTADDQYVSLRDDRAVRDAVEILNASAKQRRDGVDGPMQQRVPLPPAGTSNQPQPPPIPPAPATEADGPLLRAFRGSVSQAKWQEMQEEEAALPASRRSSEATLGTTRRRSQQSDTRVYDLPPEYAEFDDDFGRTATNDSTAGQRQLEDMIGRDSSGQAASKDPDVSSDDLYFENAMLKERLVEERAKVRRAQDKLYFLLLKVKGKDEHLASLKNGLRQKTREIEDRDAQLAALTAQKSQMQRRLENMQAHVHQLEFDKFKLMNPPVKLTDKELELSHRQGVQKAKMLLAHQLFKQQADKRIAELTAKCKVRVRGMRRKLQCLEQSCMEFEDEYSADTLHSLMRTLRFGQAQHIDEQRRQLQRELKFDRRVTLTAPDDDHVKLLLEKTHYAALMPQCKGELSATVRELKESIDKALQTLWLLFNERSTTSSRLGGGKPPHRVYDEFFQTVEQTLMRTKQMAADFPRKTNAFLRTFCAREKEVTQYIKTHRYARCDQAVEVDIPPPTPPEVFELRDEIKHYQRRLRQLSQEYAEKESALEIRAGKAESSLEYVQRHVLTLHRSLFNALHLVFKHRFRWCNRMPDPMRNFHVPDAKDRRKIFEVSYNMKLGELLQVDREYMEKFGHYMISEDFGAGGVVDGHTGGGAGAPELKRHPSGKRPQREGGASKENAGKEAPVSTPPTEPQRQPRAPTGAARSEHPPRRRLEAADVEPQDKQAPLPPQSRKHPKPPQQSGEAHSSGSDDADGHRGDPAAPLARLPSFAQPIGNVRHRQGGAGRQEPKQWAGVLQDLPARRASGAAAADDDEQHAATQPPPVQQQPQPQPQQQQPQPQAAGAHRGRAPLAMPIVADVTKFPEAASRRNSDPGPKRGRTYA
eukprot:TRINITY_DN3253_c3_g1_i1.p1 TRINITY_DN3253_c3_g1~~TRINITY_DN3253_c3_g1_i1.p1  ORF type:complete len:955 (+),score=377.33 TRINITY_DN3253_c3_g1_i1:247-2865(+)